MKTKQPENRTLYRAFYESTNFDFEAFGWSEKEALDSILKGLRMHTKQYDCDSDWFEKDEICVLPFLIGKPYRDKSELR
jgi:hypothetical protein